ncbi:MAG: META domain-containing protein [Gammaproteobacteria bacterium]
MKHLFVLGIISLMVSACASSDHSTSVVRSHDLHAVIGKTWQWQGTVTPVEKINVKQPERYTLRFDEKGRLQARFDCNRGGGSYQISESKVSFGPLMSTRMACPNDSLDDIYIKQLQDVNSFFLEGDSLYLELPFDSGTLQFK